MKMIAIVFLMIASVSGISLQDSLTLTQLFSPDELKHFHIKVDPLSGKVISLSSDNTYTINCTFPRCDTVYQYPSIIINDSIEKLDALKSLRIHGTIKALSSKIYSLVNLDTLVIINVNGGLPNTIEDNISSLTNLKYLQIKNSDISIVPEKLTSLQKLEYLDLSCNRITSLPLTMDQLGSLQTLILDRNFLVTLPDALGKLKKLSILKIRENQLETLPVLICPLLKIIDISNNYLSVFPSEICNLNELCSLDITMNRITAIPEGGWNWSKLVLFNYDEIWIQNAPSSMPARLYRSYIHPCVDYKDSSLVRALLDYLGLKHTQVWDSKCVTWNECRVVGINILSCADGIDELPGIEDFDSLKSVVLPFFPRSLCSQIQLRTLTISRVINRTLPSEIGNLVNLETLVCNACSLQVLLEELGNCYNLKSLSMAQNQLTSVPESFSNLTKLEYLNLSLNRISEITLDKMVNLTDLNLSRNGLQKFSAEHSVNMRYVNLGYNQLTDFPPDIINCSNLENLNLQSNQIESIPKGINKLQSLNRLNLTDNSIYIVPPEIAELPSSISSVSSEGGAHSILNWNCICSELLSPEAKEWMGIGLPNFYQQKETCTNKCITQTAIITPDKHDNENRLIKNGYLNINDAKGNNVAIDLFNASGKKICCIFNGNVSGAITLPVDRYIHSTGVYFVRINNNKKIHFYKYLNK
jgi:Leucine-rich repeat (LRR) protein